jgi:hypothetical protein
MSRQFENVLLNPSDDVCVVMCGCGDPRHGSIRFDVDTGPEDGEWWARWCAYVTVNMIPYPTFWARVKQAWGVLWGRPWEGDFEMSANEAKLLGQWLVKKAAECQTKVDKEREKDVP